MSTGGNRTQSWNCRACTFLNTHGRACEICGSPKDAGASAVETNTNVTEGLHIPRRTTEQRHRHDPLAGPEINEDIWPCPQCTLHNPVHLQQCQACNYKKTNDAQRVAKIDTVKNETRPGPGPNSITPNNSPFRSRMTVLLQKESIKQKYRDILTFCLEDGHPFVDDSFPPAPKSLYFKPKNSQRSKVTQWLRPEDILTDHKSRPWTVLRSPEPSDISQGVLGNCWLLSALAVIAERPQLIDNILVTKEISEVGAYMVRLCKDGRWTTMIIDDVLPCDNHKYLVYSQAKRNQLWVPLIEKAVAKIHGCYEALVSGRVIEGLSTLTGYPCETIMLQQNVEGDAEHQRFDPQMVWVNLLSFYTAGYLMGAGCGVSDIREEEYKEMGLHSRHAYSVLKLDDTNGLRLLQLRNPWGTGRWKGDWGDQSTKWTPALKEKLMPEGGGDGMFWICFNDFLRYFQTVDVCKVNPSWHEERIEGYFQRSADGRNLTCMLLRVNETTEVELTVFQKGLRHAKANKAQPAAQVDLCIAVFRVKQDYGSPNKIALGQLVVGSKRSTRSCVSCHKMLGPGTYLVLPMAFNHWNAAGLSLHESTEHRFVTALHSTRKVTFEPITQPPVSLLADAIIRMAKENGERREIYDTKEYYLTVEWSGLAVVIENCSAHKWIQVDCDCENSRNMVSSRNQMQTSDVIPPLHVQVLILLSPLANVDSYQTAYKMVYQQLPMNGARGGPSAKAMHCPPIGPELEGLHEPRPLSAFQSW